MKIKCLIADDELHARRLLADYISKLPDLELEAQCRNAMEVMQVLHDRQIDLMFLDIQMPDLTGVELLKAIKTKPVVIFTTAFREYALEGYELDVIDYMLKPIAFDRFVQGVNKAVDFIRLNSQDDKKKLMRSSPEVVNDTINLKADYRIYRVKLSDILYIEGLKEYVTFYTDARKYIVLESLRHLEEILPENSFMRIHKSYIINTQKISSLYGNIIEIGKTEIPVGKSYAAEVKGKLFGVK